LADIATEFAEARDPRAIPILIDVIAADNTYDSIYGVGFFGLTGLTGVQYDETHDDAWWRRWWEENKSKFPEAEQKAPIPTMQKKWKPGVSEPRRQNNRQRWPISKMSLPRR